MGNNADPDNEGLADTEEKMHNINLLLVDTDRDGMNEKYEVDVQLDPLTNDAAVNMYGDGYTYIEENETDSDPRDENYVPIPRGGTWRKIVPYILSQ